MEASIAFSRLKGVGASARGTQGIQATESQDYTTGFRV